MHIKSLLEYYNGKKENNINDFSTFINEYSNSFTHFETLKNEIKSFNDFRREFEDFNEKNRIRKFLIWLGAVRCVMVRSGIVK